VETLALTSLNRGSVTNQRITLDNWFERMRSKDPAQFKAWLWKRSIGLDPAGSQPCLPSPYKEQTTMHPAGRSGG
jgi:hypothetical protein